MEPIFLQDEYTGAIVRDQLGNAIVIGTTPARPCLSYMGTPPMSYAMPSQPLYPAATPMIAPLHPGINPGIHRPGGYNYSYGPGCCAGGLAGLGCCLCCDSCCLDCDLCCRECCY